MSYGQGIAFTNNFKPGGPPFPTTAAENGACVNATTGRINWGQDDAWGFDIATMLYNTRIPMNGNYVRFLSDLAVFNPAQLIWRLDDPNVFFSMSSRTNFGANAQQAGFFQGEVRLSNDDPVQGPVISLLNSIAAQNMTIENRGGVLRFSWNGVVKNTMSTTNITSAGDIKTQQPSGNGQGAWKLGKRLAAGVALDAAHYVEVMIDGTLVKLGIVV